MKIGVKLKTFFTTMLSERRSTNPESCSEFGRGRWIDWRLHMDTPIYIHKWKSEIECRLNERMKTSLKLIFKNERVKKSFRRISWPNSSKTLQEIGRTGTLFFISFLSYIVDE